MRVYFDKTGSLASLAEQINELISAADIHGLIILGCDKNNWQAEAADEYFKSLSLPVFGGIFPQIIHELKNHETGTIVATLSVKPDVFTLTGLGTPETDFNQQLDTFCEMLEAGDSPENETIFVFVDGLAGRISSLIESLFFNIGGQRTFLGGGAGSLSFQQKPCIISNSGLTKDSAVIVRLPMAAGTGVTHGWTPISETMEITGSQGNVVESIDWKPAYQVYRELVESHSQKSFSQHDFFALAKSYPLGIARLDSEFIVRDPFAIEGDKLVCVGDVPQGSFIQLLHGNAESLIASASIALKLATQTLNGARSDDYAFVVDCISRVLFLDEEMSKELQAISADGRIFGAMTIGEIACNGKDFLEFFNKTTVVGVFGNPDMEHPDC